MTKLVVGLKMRDMRNNVHYEFVEEALTIANRNLQDIAMLNYARNCLDKAVEAERKLFEISRGCDITAELETLNGARHKVFRGMFLYIESATHHFDSEIRVAAERLLVIVKRRGNITRLPYDDASAAYTDLVREMSSTEILPLVMTVDVKSWVDNLNETNFKFVQTMLKRYSTTYRVEIAGKTDKVRRESDHCLRALTDQVDALVLVGASDIAPALSQFVHDYNELASRHKRLLAVARGRRKASVSIPVAPPFATDDFLNDWE
jgi:hypothetical protein